MFCVSHAKVSIREAGNDWKTKNKKKKEAKRKKMGVAQQSRRAVAKPTQQLYSRRAQTFTTPQCHIIIISSAYY